MTEPFCDGLVAVGLGVAATAEPLTEDVGVADVAGALDSMDCACAGVMVVVEVEVLAVALVLAVVLVAVPVRILELKGDGTLSINVMRGPASNCVVARSTTLLTRGWPSVVMKTATGPSMPGGTTHWLNGSGMAVAIPPTIIWQNNVLVETEPLIAGELKDN